MFVADVMSRTLVTLTSDQTLIEAITLLRSHHIRHLPVVDGTTLVGIVTDRDIKRATPSVFSGDQEEYDRVLATTVIARCMTRELITVTPKTDLKTAIEIFLERKVGALPVVDREQLVGILTDIDILRVALDLLPKKKKKA